MLSVLCTTALLSCSQQASASLVPMSRKKVVLGAVLAGAGTWIAGYYLNVDKTKLDIASGIASLVSGLIFSRYTAKSYLASGKRIINSEDLFIISWRVDGRLNTPRTAQEIAQEVAASFVDRFSAHRNELAKAVLFLEMLADELEKADYYFLVAYYGLSGCDARGALDYRDKVYSYLTAVRAASLIIKNHPDYQVQYAAEREERRIQAEFARAAAERERANAEYAKANAELVKACTQ